MKNLYYLNSQALIAITLRQMSLQQQLIEAQQQVIDLQKQIDKMTPKTPKDTDVFWHLVSDGLTSTEAATSADPVTVRQFLEWNLRLAEKYIRPYVNPKVYSECVNQMTRGLAERIASGQTQSDIQFLKPGRRP